MYTGCWRLRKAALQPLEDLLDVELRVAPWHEPGQKPGAERARRPHLAHRHCSGAVGGIEAEPQFPTLAPAAFRPAEAVRRREVDHFELGHPLAEMRPDARALLDGTLRDGRLAPGQPRRHFGGVGG